MTDTRWHLEEYDPELDVPEATAECVDDDDYEPVEVDG